MGKPLRIFTASESEKFEATKGQKEIVWGVCLQIHYTSFKLLMQPQVCLEKGGAPWNSRGCSEQNAVLH